MSKRELFIITLIFCLCQIFFVFGLLMIAIYYEPVNEITYTTPITFKILYTGLHRVTFPAIKEAMTFLDIIYFVNVVTGISIIYVTKSKEKSLLRAFFFMSQLFICFWGWLGFFLIPEAIFTGIDGEWLGEYSPTIIATGFWIVFSIIVAILSFNFKAIRKKKIFNRLHTH
jgi:hypothetical protein